MWEKGGRKRLYLNEAGGKIVGLEFEYYKSGNVASATFNGEPISNRRGIFLSGVTNRAYIDMNTGKLYTGVGLQGSEERAEAVSKLKKFFGI